MFWALAPHQRELWVVCVYLQNGWEDGNDKNTNTLGE